MLKTISAALLAVSVLAAPALAAAPAKTAPAKQATIIKAEPVKQLKPAVRNANAGMHRHHYKHARHHRSHARMGALKTHQVSKVTVKHVAPSAKRV